MKTKETTATKIAAKVAEQLENIKSETKKVTAKKNTTKKLVPISKEEPKEEPKAKTTKAKVIKETEERQKVNLVEKVIAHREVKYIYPDDVVDTLARKKWRQQTRNKLHELELKMNRLREADKKEFEKAKKAFEDYRKTVLKPEQVA